jgi:hypothetical protein
MMSEPKMLTAAFVISLVAGILIVLGSLSATIGVIRMMGGGYGWMTGQPAYGAMASIRILGLVSGIIVLISAIMLKVRPGEATRGIRACCTWWGSIILVFSIVSLFGGSMGDSLLARYSASSAVHLHCHQGLRLVPNLIAVA